MTNRKILHCLLLVIIGLACYSNSFTVPFSFDDEINIAGNTLIRDLGNFTDPAPRHAFDAEYNPRRYIGLLTFALDYKLHGLDVVGYHVVNISIHITNAVLVYFLVLLTFGTPYFSPQGGEAESKGQRVEEKRQDSALHALCSMPPAQFIALFAALLFVAHPIQTQAVTYIVQRYTSLATLFYLLSVVMYIKGRLASLGPMQLFRGPMPYGICSLLSAVLAMKTKEISFTLPFVIVLYEFLFFTTPVRKKLLFLVPFLLTLIIIPVTIMGTDRPLGEIISDLSARTRLQTDMPRLDYLFTEMRVIVTYLRLLVVPVNQSLDYDYPVYHSLFSPQVFMSFLFISALLATAIYMLYKSRMTDNCQQSAGESKPSALGHQRSGSSNRSTTQPLDDSCFTFHYSRFALYRLVAFGIFWFFIALSVESSVIPITDVIFEHRVYLPSVGAFIALAAGLYAASIETEKRLPWARKAIIPLVLIILMSLTAATFMRNRVWKDNVTLWEDAVEKFPHGLRPRVMLGQALLREGNADRAIDEFQKALEIKPFSFNARIYLGLAFASKGWNDEAIEQYRMAILINPGSADARNSLGVALFKKGAIEQAIEQYKAALGLNPADSNFHHNLGIAFERLGLIDDAIKEYSAAAQLNPSEPAYRLALANASGKRNPLPEGGVR